MHSFIVQNKNIIHQIFIIKQKISISKKYNGADHTSQSVGLSQYRHLWYLQVNGSMELRYVVGFILFPQVSTIQCYGYNQMTVEKKALSGAEEVILLRGMQLLAILR